MELNVKQQTMMNASTSGMALVVALGVLFALTALSTALLTSFHASFTQAQNRARQTRCLNIAEAGIEKALVEYRISSGVYSGETDTLFSDGIFSVEVTPSDLSRFTLESTGVLNHGPDVQAVVVVDAALDPNGRVRVLSWEESYR